MKIGFVGLGVMGKSIAKNIIKGGYDLKVFDIVEDAVKELESAGASSEKSPKDLAKDRDVIFTSLPNSAIVENVITGENGILEGAKEGSIIVDLSSITPSSIKKIYKKAIQKNVEVVDAPVSGGSAGAEKGTLIIIAGGKKEAIDKINPVFEIIGKKIHHVGDVGAGDTMKLVNNLLLGANMVAVAEALVLGKKAGLDPDTMYEVIEQSSGSSYALKAKYPSFIKKRDFSPGFMVDLQYKDLELAVTTAKEMKLPLMIGNLSQQLFEIAKTQGHGSEDISSVINIYEKWADTIVGKEG